jgi:hypothetical protein
MQSGQFPADAFISSVIEPSQAAEALTSWAEAPGKVFRILVKF